MLPERAGRSHFSRQLSRRSMTCGQGRLRSRAGRPCGAFARGALPGCAGVSPARRRPGGSATPPKAGPGTAGILPARFRKARRWRVGRGRCALPGGIRGDCDVRAGTPAVPGQFARGALPGCAGVSPARYRSVRRWRAGAVVAPFPARRALRPWRRIGGGPARASNHPRSPMSRSRMCGGS